MTTPSELAALTKALELYEGKASGSLRIDVSEVRTILSALRRVEKMEGALGEAEQTLALSEFPSREDPEHGPEVRALGERIGFGAVIASASASWRLSLAAKGHPVGGEHVSGPCQATVTATLKAIRQALTGEAQ